jgi:hypothetical protein
VVWCCHRQRRAAQPCLLACRLADKPVAWAVHAFLDRDIGSGAGRRHGEVMRVEVSPEAAEFVRARGGRLWVWAARPPKCCTPAFMRAATEPPPGLSGFHLVRAGWSGGLFPRVRRPGSGRAGGRVAWQAAAKARGVLGWRHVRAVIRALVLPRLSLAGSERRRSEWPSA